MMFMINTHKYLISTRLNHKIQSSGFETIFSRCKSTKNFSVIP